MSEVSLEPKKHLRIGLVFDDSLDRPDGVQQYVLTMGSWLQNQGHDVHYLVSTTYRNDIGTVHNLGPNVEVHFNGNQLRTPRPASIYHIRELLRKIPYDILHVQMPYSPMLAGRVIASAQPETGIVGTFHVVPHSAIAASSTRLLATWTRHTTARIDSVMSVSTAAQAFAKQAYKLTSTIVPNAIQLSKFQSALPFRKKDQDVTTIVFLGRLVPRKGCMLLLQAIVLLVKNMRMPKFRVLICGAGPLATDLKQFALSNGLGKVVRFEGFIPEKSKPRYLASADITVFPSSGGESFGIVLAEAMAAGDGAVIGGDNAGYRSVLEHCPGDVLFSTKDPTSLTRILERLLTDGALRRHIAAWQARHVQQYDVEQVGPAVLRTYESALRHRRNMR